MNAMYLLGTGMWSLISFLTLCMHYKSHFKLNAAGIMNKMNSKPAKKLQNKRWCCLSPIGNQEFDYFPMAFLSYILCVICLSAVAVSKYIITYSNKRYLSNPFVFDDAHEMSTIMRDHKHGLLCLIFDYIIIYSVPFICLWSTFHNFCRYFSTKAATATIRVMAMSQIFKRFSIYIIAFIVAFTLPMYVFYDLFSILIVMHFTFNLYCVHKASSLLCDHYKPLLNHQMSIDSQQIINVLNCVMIMKKVSIISICISTVCLGIFFCSNQVNSAYYLPILWSIECFIFSLNFFRNRKWLKNMCSAILCTHSQSEMSTVEINAASEMQPPKVPKKVKTLPTPSVRKNFLSCKTPHSAETPQTVKSSKTLRLRKIAQTPHSAKTPKTAAVQSRSPKSSDSDYVSMKDDRCGFGSKFQIVANHINKQNEIINNESKVKQPKPLTLHRQSIHSLSEKKMENISEGFVFNSAEYGSEIDIEALPSIDISTDLRCHPSQSQSATIPPSFVSKATKKPDFVHCMSTIDMRAQIEEYTHHFSINNILSLNGFCPSIIVPKGSQNVISPSIVSSV